jgi:hypothetical protein
MPETARNICDRPDFRADPGELFTAWTSTALAKIATAYEGRPLRRQKGYLEALRVLSERQLRNAVSAEISFSVISLPNCR